MTVNLQPGQWALVTGASSGIGEAFAEKLATMKLNLVLTARRGDRLRLMAERVSQEHGIQTHIIPLDLSRVDAADQLYSQVKELNISIDMLVNNAGLGLVEDIKKTSRERILNIIQVNITCLTELCYLFLPGMMERKRGVIVNVASVVGFMPVCYMGVYAASKAYVLSLTESLWAETRKADVCVTALCPGTTRTEFFDQAGASGWLRGRSSQTPAQVVHYCLNEINQSRPHLVSGFANRLMVLLPRLFSRGLVVRTTKRFFQSSIDG